MVVEYVRYTIPEERREAFERAYAEAARSLDVSPECVAYELAHCMEDLASYVLRIEWTSYDGHMLGFRKSGEFQAFLRAVQPYISNIAEMRHYALTDISRRSISNGARVWPS